LLHVAGPSGLVSAFRPTQQLSPRIFGLTNGAGGLVTGEISPGQIVSIYGVGIGPEKPATFTLDQNRRVPTSLSGVELFFDDIPAPLLYVSANQINAIVPNALQPRTSIPVHLTADTPRFLAQVSASSPGVFAVRNPDGSPNDFSNPAPAGSVLTLWLTGVGADARPDGSVATGAHDTGCCQARSRDGLLEVLYAGDAPGFVTALTQINLRVPSSNDLIDITTAGGRKANVRISVKP
jgi:uncharacterized protein (TIGR03437 family)